ncbi:MAG: peptide chain release factor H [Treponema sp.]|jgi:peptide chain release factor|nr:peptide chain release factor H [Treponema sp.]
MFDVAPSHQELSLDTIWLSVSAGTGPEECAHAAALTLRVLQRELEEARSGVTLRIIDVEPSSKKGDIRSALIALEGEEARQFALSWIGIVQWIWRSAYRPHHKRKNWFVSVKPFVAPEQGETLSLSDVRFETVRAGGPGGQYVNKTESAVRAVHIPTGKSATAREERSQLLNKNLALARLASLFVQKQADEKKQSKSKLRHTHWELERGNPIRIYDGETLQLINRPALKSEAHYPRIPIKEEKHHD